MSAAAAASRARGRRRAWPSTQGATSRRPTSRAGPWRWRRSACCWPCTFRATRCRRTRSPVSGRSRCSPRGPGCRRHGRPRPDTALADLQRDLLYVALFGLGLLAAGSGRHAALVGRVVLAVIVVIAGAGLLHGAAGDRLGYPLTYWNAYGALAAVGVVLAAGLGSDPRAPVPVRALCGAAVVPLAVAVYLSLSRGTWLALIVGVVVLVALGAHRGSLLLTGAVAGTAATLAILAARDGALHRSAALLTAIAGASSP